MNKKGFTLVELLVTVALIVLLFGIGIPGVMKISERVKNKTQKTKIELIIDAAKLYGQNNKSTLNETTCTIDNKTRECKKISIKNLIEEDYLDSESKTEISYINPTTNIDISNTCVYIYIKSNRVYSYYPENDTSCIEE